MRPQFIENAVCREAEVRAEQNAAVARAKKALRNADKGVGPLTAEDFLAGMERRAQMQPGARSISCCSPPGTSMNTTIASASAMRFR